MGVGGMLFPQDSTLYLSGLEISSKLGPLDLLFQQADLSRESQIITQKSWRPVKHESSQIPAYIVALGKILRGGSLRAEP